MKRSSEDGDKDNSDETHEIAVSKKTKTEKCSDKTTSPFTSQLNLEDIRQMQAEFCKERNWDQYHSPRNVLLALVGEVGEVAELFQWRGEVKEGLDDWSAADKRHLSHELSDVLIYLVRLADRCDVDLPKAVMEKFEINRNKYPTDKVFGSSKKYTEYKESDETSYGFLQKPLVPASLEEVTMGTILAQNWKK